MGSFRCVQKLYGNNLVYLFYRIFRRKLIQRYIWVKLNYLTVSESFCGKKSFNKEMFFFHELSKRITKHLADIFLVCPRC